MGWTMRCSIIACWRKITEVLRRGTGSQLSSIFMATVQFLSSLRARVCSAMHLAASASAQFGIINTTGGHRLI